MAREERVLTTPKFPIKSLPLKHTESRFLTPSEVRRILEAARVDSNPVWTILIIVALNTGMRIGELLALDWMDIDLKARRLTVRHSLCRRSGIKAPKNGKTREVELTDAAHDALSILECKSGRVFDFAYETAYVAINRIADKAGLPDVGWHTMRHTFASLLVMESVPLLTVSRLLGHSSVRITERYAHLLREKQQDAMATLAMALGA
jgi:integrase